MVVPCYIATLYYLFPFSKVRFGPFEQILQKRMEEGMTIVILFSLYAHACDNKALVTFFLIEGTG